MPGGAEKVTVELANAFPADVVVGFDRSSKTVSFSLDDNGKLVSLDADSSFLLFRTLRLIFSFTYRTGFLNDYSWVIYSGNYAPLAVQNHHRGKNVLYCHTPPRFIYDLKGFYQDRYKGMQAPIFNSLIRILKPRYEDALDKMDIIVANSENVRGRINRYLGKEAIVIHPPCAIENKRWIGQDGYYLSLARLEPYKRVDKLIEAFMRMPERELVVVSGGSDYNRLKNLARNAKNISFTGWISEMKLNGLIGRAIASLYVPLDEDFGMSPVESMAAGKPVIGVAEGGLLETVIPGETGILVSKSLTIEEIICAIKELSPDRAREMRYACENRAKLFSQETFLQKMREVIV